MVSFIQRRCDPGSNPGLRIHKFYKSFSCIDNAKNKMSMSSSQKNRNHFVQFYGNPRKLRGKVIVFIKELNSGIEYAMLASNQKEDISNLFGLGFEKKEGLSSIEKIADIFYLPNLIQIYKKDYFMKSIDVDKIDCGEVFSNLEKVKEILSMMILIYGMKYEFKERMKDKDITDYLLEPFRRKRLDGPQKDI